MINLYDYALSGNCYKVRMLLGFLGQEFESELVDFYPGFEHKSDAFLRINPLGQLPVIEMNGQTIRDAQAILVHLAATLDAGGSWYPLDQPAKLGPIQSWLAFADGLTSAISGARLHDAMFFDLPIEKLRADGLRLLRILDEHLWFQEQAGCDWLCEGDHPTIADLACFPYVALCEEAGISQMDYPAIQRWLERFMRLDGFVPMAGMMPLEMPK